MLTINLEVVLEMAKNQQHTGPSFQRLDTSIDLLTLPKEHVRGYYLIGNERDTGNADHASIDVADVVLVDAIHDGYVLPDSIWNESHQQDAGTEVVHRYVKERDWGAARVALYLADFLGLEGYYRMDVARALLDLSRFPGNSGSDADLFTRLCIGYPFSEILTPEQKEELLVYYYDKPFHTCKEVLKDKKIRIALHTYDRYDQAGNERPQISLITRPISYQLKSELPIGLYDPLFPSFLNEFVCNRRLTYSIALALEDCGYHVSHNYPYCLPDTSIEIRLQVVFFFESVLSFYDSTDEAWLLVKETLLDVNKRSVWASLFRQYVHNHLPAPAAHRALFEEARQKYYLLCAEQCEQRHVVENYKHDRSRISTLVIEVRKDLLWDFDDYGFPMRPLKEHAINIAAAIAEAVEAYLIQDVSQSR